MAAANQNFPHVIPANNRNLNQQRLELQTLEPMEMLAPVNSLQCKIEHFGDRSEMAWFLQFANQHSRFTPFKHDSRFVWKLLSKGQMLVVDSFMNKSSIFHVLSNTPKREPLKTFCFEQVDQNYGFIVYCVEDCYYLAFAHLGMNQELLEVDVTNAVKLWDLRQYSFSVVSIDWSKIHEIGIVMLGRATFEVSAEFFFSMTLDGNIKILKRQANHYPNPPIPTALPLFQDDDNEHFMTIKHSHNNKWSHFKGEKKNFARNEERELLFDKYDKVATRFYSAWLNKDQNLFLEHLYSNSNGEIFTSREFMYSRKPLKNFHQLNLYDRLTKKFQEIKLPQLFLSKINDSLNSSMFVTNDDVMLILTHDKLSRALTVHRVPLRKPERFTNLTIMSYRQSKFCTETNTAKLQNILFPQRMQQKFEDETRVAEKRSNSSPMDYEPCLKKLKKELRVAKKRPAPSFMDNDSSLKNLRIQ